MLNAEIISALINQTLIVFFNYFIVGALDGKETSHLKGWKFNSF